MCVCKIFILGSLTLTQSLELFNKGKANNSNLIANLTKDPQA